jgi:hypothetical protein
MINKKNLLGKEPEVLGDKDAVHVAMVACRAGVLIQPGQRCGLNNKKELVPNPKGPGIADPFRKTPILRGEKVWLLMNQDEIPNVQHTWEHPTVDFSPPSIEASKNATIGSVAEYYGVSYEQVMKAAQHVVKNDTPAKFPNKDWDEKFEIAFSEGDIDSYDFWYEWANETGHEFDNYGSACCPEYNYPECELFHK